MYAVRILFRVSRNPIPIMLILEPDEMLALIC